jgi:hypothetical protein
MPDLQTYRCPACGANLTVAPNPGPTITCTFCGTSIRVPDEWRTPAAAGSLPALGEPYAPAGATLTGPALLGALTDWLFTQADRQTGQRLAGQPVVGERISRAADKALRELGSGETADINLPFLTADGSGPKHFELTLTRAQVDALARGGQPR